VWTEHTARALPALGTDGPVTVRPGEVVVVAVVSDMEKALEVVERLAETEPVKHRGKR
jgi:hypothetical protein